MGIGALDASRVPWRNLAAAAACAALGLLAFGRDARVPLLGWIDLCVHEAGHVATALAPPLVTAMAGSAAQVALPLALAAAFWILRREPLSAMLCVAWAGTSAHDAAAYIADAPYERLELIGGTHDWAYALGPDGFDALGSAGATAAAVRGAGFLLVVLATAWCLLSPLRARGESPGRTPDGRVTAGTSDLASAAWPPEGETGGSASSARSSRAPATRWR